MLQYLGTVNDIHQWNLSKQELYRCTGVQVNSEDWWDKATRHVYLTQNRPDDVPHSFNTTLLSDELLA